MSNFEFWIETEGGEHILWRGLTKKQAEGMYKATDKSVPDNVKRYGWGETK